MARYDLACAESETVCLLQRGSCHRCLEYVSVYATMRLQCCRRGTAQLFPEQGHLAPSLVCIRDEGFADALAFLRKALTCRANFGAVGSQWALPFAGLAGVGRVLRMGARLSLPYGMIRQKTVACDLIRQVFVLFRQNNDGILPSIGDPVHLLQLACQGELVAFLV